QHLFLFLAFISALLIAGTGCDSQNDSKKENLTQEELRKKLDKKESPVIEASETLKHFVLEKYFNIQLAAFEPIISAPVTASFDRQGRLWAVEMNAYMPDT